MGRTIIFATIAGFIGGGIAAFVALTVIDKRDDPGETVAALVERQTTMDRAIGDLRTTVEQVDVRSALSALGERVDLVELQKAPLDALERLQNEVNQLEESYRAEVASLRGARAKAAAAALAVREIQAAVQDGRVFAAALNELDRIMQDDTVIQNLADSLRAYDDGVATLTMLSQQLDTLRVDYLQSQGDGTGGWVNRTVDNLRALIDVDGVPQLQGVDGLLLDARDKTVLDQLPAAISELEPLVEEVDGLADWIGRARARQAARDLVAAIDRHLDERVSRQG